MDNAIAPFGIFKTKDNSIALAIGNETQWQIFVQFLLSKGSKLDLDLYKTNSDRIKNLNKLKNDIENIFTKYSAKELVCILEEFGTPCGIVNTMIDVLNDQENYNEGLLEKVEHPLTKDIVVSTGGIFFSGNKRVDYRIAPNFNKK